MRYAIDVQDDTVASLEQALAQLRGLGIPDTAKIRIKIRASFNKDGGYARAVTARWTLPADA